VKSLVNKVLGGLGLKRKPSLFFITSFGRTATAWVASTLTLHPQVLCSHAALFEPFNPHHKEAEEKERTIRAQRDEVGFYKMTLKQIYDRYRQERPDMRCVGNVHAFTAASLEHKRLNEPGAPPYTTVNLLRQPIVRMDSLWRRWRYERKLETPFAQWIEKTPLEETLNKDAYAELRRRHDISLDSFDDRAFFHAVFQLHMDDNDLLVKTVEHISSERLVSDIDYFAYVAERLFGKAVPITAAWLREVEALGKVHASEGGSRNALQIFEEWKPWQRSVLSIFLDTRPNLKTEYPRYGYNLSLFTG